MRVVDISDPFNPVGKGCYDTPGTAQGVVVSDNYIYIADGRYFNIFDCSALLTEPDQDRNLPPEKFTIGPTYPNPFNSTVTLPFGLPRAGEVTFKVFNILGQRVFSHSQIFKAGSHSFQFHASEISGNSGKEMISGVYFLQVSFDGQSNIQK